MSDQAPRVEKFTAFIPAPAAAGTAQDQVVVEAPFAGTVTEVTAISEGAVTADATNNRTLQVVNKGQDGTGTTVVASLALDTAGTDNLVAKDEKTIPLSGVAGATTVAAGDVLIWNETTGGTGLAHTGLTVEVSISRS